MHYKRQKRHGSPDYRWGGRLIGRPCSHCDRPAIAREMCFRHYQMWRNHGDPLYSDAKKVAAMPAGEHMRRGYRMVTPSAEVMVKAEIAGPQVERSHRHHRRAVEPKGLRDGSQRTRRTWEHRKVAGAKPGQIVHHIDGDKLNNARQNLHVFNTPAEHGRAHRSLEEIAYALLKSGQVEFDPAEGVYKLRASVDRSS